MGHFLFHQNLVSRLTGTSTMGTRDPSGSANTKNLSHRFRHVGIPRGRYWREEVRFESLQPFMSTSGTYLRS
jgi:hypothetical protein